MNARVLIVDDSMVMDALEHGALNFIIKLFMASRVMESIKRCFAMQM